MSVHAASVEQARSGGFLRAHHDAHLVRVELLPRVGPADVPDLVAPMVVELRPDPTPTPPGHDDCFARLLSHVLGHENTTVHR
jgi:hypothetical protein